MASSVTSSKRLRQEFVEATALLPKHIEQLHMLYQNESWSKGRTLEETRRCAGSSTLVFALMDERENLAAFTRVISDKIFKAIIFDVIVDEKYRGDGLGDRLVSMVKNHPELIAVKHFELYCLPELEPFYERHGFTTEVSNMRLMRHTNTSRKI